MSRMPKDMRQLMQQAQQMQEQVVAAKSSMGGPAGGLDLGGMLG